MKRTYLWPLLAIALICSAGATLAAGKLAPTVRPDAPQRPLTVVEQVGKQFDELALAYRHVPVADRDDFREMMLEAKRGLADARTRFEDDPRGATDDAIEVRGILHRVRLLVPAPDLAGGPS